MGAASRALTSPAPPASCGPPSPDDDPEASPAVTASPPPSPGEGDDEDPEHCIDHATNAASARAFPSFRVRMGERVDAIRGIVKRAPTRHRARRMRGGGGGGGPAPGP